MDFSPQHPDDWASTDAERWNLYIQYRDAYEEGVSEVRNKWDERKEQDQRSKKGMADLLKQHEGAAF